jgi:hypothetical protein
VCQRERERERERETLSSAQTVEEFMSQHEQPTENP